MENNNINPNGDAQPIEPAAPQSVDNTLEQQASEAVNVSNAETEPIYSYTAVNNSVGSPEPQRFEQPFVPNEPTQQFETAVKPESNNSNAGLKVFFSILAVTVALIIAVSSGYIFGSRGGTPSFHFTQSTPLADKGDTQQFANKTAVFNQVNPSVVAITVYTSKGIAGYASGVIYTEDGYIVTNDHIYTNIASPMFLITMYDGTELDAEFIAGDTRSDLAVLKVKANGLPKASFGNSAQIDIGEEVIAIGYPSGASGRSILTSGTISSNSIRFTSTSSYSVKMIQTDTAINPGNSGGALVNMYGQVIGIPSVKMAGTEYDNVGYAIPSNTVVKVVDSLIEHGYVVGRGRLGIQYTEVDGITAELSGIPTGLMVREITVESELYGKGIAVNDIITHINDVEITESSIALDIIESTEPGKVMTFTVYSASDGSTKNYYASLIEDQGNSSYTNSVTEDGGISDPFGNGGLDDFFSDH